MTGQFGKNHLGDRDEMLPTAHGFDEFFGNLYHLDDLKKGRKVDRRSLLPAARDNSRLRDTARSVGELIIKRRAVIGFTAGSISKSGSRTGTATG